MIDTHVDGSVVSVRAGATWLRDVLKAKVGDAADDANAAARNSQGDWEGRDQTAYYYFDNTLIAAMDDHDRRIGRAAHAFDDYAVRLHRIQHHMGNLRIQAAAGGLAVFDEKIQEPEPAAAVPDLPAGSTPEQEDQHKAAMKAHDAQVTKIDLYQRLERDVTSAWKNFGEYCDSDLVAAQKDAEDDDHVSSLKDFAQKNGLNFVGGASVEFFRGDMEKRADGYRTEADDLRRAQRSGNPARRARGRAPGTSERIRGLRRAARGLTKWGRVLGPVGIAIDIGFGIWDVAHGGSPGRAIVTTGAGILGGVAAAAGIVALTAALGVSAPVWGTALAVGAVAVGVGWAAGKGWDALPDSFTDGVDDVVADTWDGAKAAASDGWHAVTSWL